jgi:hypothetical protein
VRALSIVLSADYGVWGGPVLIVAAVLLMLIGFACDRARFGKIGGAIGVLFWLLLVTCAMTLCLYAMGEAGRAGGWRLPALVAALLPFIAAAEWSLRRVRAP